MRAIALVLLLAACSDGAGHGGNGDRQAAKPEAPPAPSGTPRREATGSCVGPIMDSQLDRCDFAPRARLRGVWVSGFERSEYVPGGTGAYAPGDPPAPRYWLSFAPGVTPDPAVRAELDALRTTGAVDIEFEGRMARPPGAVVVVDRIISMRVLGPTREAR